MFLPKHFYISPLCLGVQVNVEIEVLVNGSTCCTVLALLLYRRYSPLYYYTADPMLSILLYNRGTRLNAMKRFCAYYSLTPKRFDNFPPDRGMLRRLRCVQNFL